MVSLYWELRYWKHESKFSGNTCSFVNSKIAWLLWDKCTSELSCDVLVGSGSLCRQKSSSSAKNTNSKSKKMKTRTHWTWSCHSINTDIHWVQLFTACCYFVLSNCLKHSNASGKTCFSGFYLFRGWNFSFLQSVAIVEISVLEPGLFGIIRCSSFLVWHVRFSEIDPHRAPI